MASRFTELSIDARDIRALSRFWAAALDYRVVLDEDDEIQLAGPPGAGPTLVFAPVPEPKTVKNRLHLDLVASDRDQAAEVERLLALGARRVDVGQGEATWVVLADPEGNEFCVLRGRVDPL